MEVQACAAGGPVGQHYIRFFVTVRVSFARSDELLVTSTTATN